MLRKCNILFGTKDGKDKRNTTTDSLGTITNSLLTVKHVIITTLLLDALVLPHKQTFYSTRLPACNSSTYDKWWINQCQYTKDISLYTIKCNLGSGSWWVRDVNDLVLFFCRHRQVLNGIKREKKYIASHGADKIVYAYQHKRSSRAAPTTWLQAA